MRIIYWLIPQSTWFPNLFGVNLSDQKRASRSLVFCVIWLFDKIIILSVKTQNEMVFYKLQAKQSFTFVQEVILIKTLSSSFKFYLNSKKSIEVKSLKLF